MCLRNIRNEQNMNTYAQSFLFTTISQLDNLEHRIKTNSIPMSIKKILESFSKSYVRKNISYSILKQSGLISKEYIDYFLMQLYACRKHIAVNFYTKKNKNTAEAYGIDYRMPLAIIERKQISLYQWCKARINNKGNAEIFLGDYYSLDACWSPEELGTSSVYELKQNNKIVGTTDRVLMKFECLFNSPKEMLLSTSSNIDDTWTKEGYNIPTLGGGTQIYLPLTDVEKQDLLSRGKIM